MQFYPGPVDGVGSVMVKKNVNLRRILRVGQIQSVEKQILNGACVRSLGRLRISKPIYLSLKSQDGRVEFMDSFAYRLTTTGESLLCQLFCQGTGFKKYILRSKQSW